MQYPANNRAIIAAAGTRKTESIIEAALSTPSRRVLITTYTLENIRQITERIEARTGVLPPHIRVIPWFSFLLRDAVRPYQPAVFDETNVVRAVNFLGRRPGFPKRGTRPYYLDRNRDVYSDYLSDLACLTDERSGGAVISRIEGIVDDLYVDEVQDLVGYDLDFLDLLFKSRVAVTAVGDPRQYTLSTNHHPINKKYRGAGFAMWIDERVSYCHREDRHASDRCRREICEFGSAIFPELPAMTPIHEDDPGHRGIHFVEPHEIHDYVAAHGPQILRHNKRANTFGYPAMNFGVAKGRTYDHVLIVPTGPIKQYLKERDPSKLKAPERLYVAVTRARYSVAFISDWDRRSMPIGSDATRSGRDSSA